MQTKPAHYWAIHKVVTRRMWNGLTSRQRDIVSHDTDHKTETFQRFDDECKAETERIINDETHPLNEGFLVYRFDFNKIY